MIISAIRLLGYVDPALTYKVIDMQGADAFPADFDRIRELVAEGHVCGNVRGTRLRYIELLVPLAETAPSKKHLQRASAGCKAQDSQTTYRGRDELALTYGHAFAACASYGGSAKAYREMSQVGIA